MEIDIFYRALFTSEWNNSERRVYSIPGVSPDMMRLIIEYAYTRTVPVTTENVQQLLAAADQFSIMGIVRACCEFLEGQLCLQNCIGICKFADFYSCTELRQRAYLYILHNFEDMVRVSEEFLELSLSELCGIIEKDDLNVKQEEVVYEAVQRWIAHEPQQRKKHIIVLLPKVRDRSNQLKIDRFRQIQSIFFSDTFSKRFQLCYSALTLEGRNRTGDTTKLPLSAVSLSESSRP